MTVTTTATVTTTPTATPMVVPGYGDWKYKGCFNETTGVPMAGNVRALADNSVRASPSLLINTV